MKAGVDAAALQSAGHALHQVRALGSTGSPLPEDVQRWGAAQFKALHPDAGWEVFWCNISGGTDFCGAFIGSHRELPQVPGQMQCRLLGCAVEAWNEAGQSVIGEVGELVCTRPIPSMPLYFWNDEGHARYLSSYFDMYSTTNERGEKRLVWRHGDWLKIGVDGGCIIYGRSDATINRAGLRMGTSEIYAAVEALPEVLDSMVVDLEYLGRDSFMPLLWSCVRAWCWMPRSHKKFTMQFASNCRHVSSLTKLYKSRRFRARSVAKSRSCPSRNSCWAKHWRR